MENRVFLFDTASGGKCLTTQLLQSNDFVTSPLLPLHAKSGCNKRVFVNAIKRAFEFGTVCGDSITPRFFNDAVKKNTILIAVVQMSAAAAEEIDRGVDPIDLEAVLDDNLRGFVMARSESAAASRDLYIDLICASAPKGNPGLNGKALMVFVTRYARYMGFTEVTLSAIAPVLTYYPRLGLGFKYRKSCRDAPVPVTKDFLCSKMEGKNPFAPKNVKTADFMLQLNHAGVEHTHDRGQSACAREGLSMGDFRENRCYADGYILKKCFEEDGRSSKSPKIDCPRPSSTFSRRYDWSFISDIPRYIEEAWSSVMRKK